MVSMGGHGRLAVGLCVGVGLAFSGLILESEAYDVKTAAPTQMRKVFFSELGAQPVKTVGRDLYTQSKAGVASAVDKAKAASLANGRHRIPHRMHYVVLWMVRRLFAANQVHGYINNRFWAELDTMLDIYMRRWYDALPVRNMRLIVFKSLADLYTMLEPRLAGTQSLEALDDVLTDPESTVLKIWTSASCINIANQSSTFNVANSMLTAKFGPPLPFGVNVKKNSGVPPEETDRLNALAHSTPFGKEKPPKDSGDDDDDDDKGKGKGKGGK